MSIGSPLVEGEFLENPRADTRCLAHRPAPANPGEAGRDSFVTLRAAPLFVLATALRRFGGAPRFAWWRARTWREMLHEHQLGAEWDVRECAAITDRLLLVHEPPSAP